MGTFYCLNPAQLLLYRHFVVQSVNYGICYVKDRHSVIENG